MTFANATLSDCLKFAYGLRSDAQILGASWIKSKEVRFDIVAQASPETERSQIELMLQALLAERLNLVVHHEQKELTFLALVVGKNGPKLRPATAESPGGPMVLGRIINHQMTMPLLASLLSRFERQTIVDETGLTGAFDVNLEWVSERSGGATASDVRTAEAKDNPSLFTAVQEQLGLKLEARKGPFDVLAVDSAEKVPTDN